MITRLLRALHEPLLLEPRFGQLLTGVFARKLAGEAFDGARLHAELGIATPDARPRREPVASIAVIPIYGVIAQHPQSLGISTDEIDAMVASALASSSVDAILFDIDSPGGTVGGVPETAERIREAGKVKPTAAVANGMAASAAYWLASQTQHITVLRSGEGVGSIGVYTAHEDWSKALEAEGVTITPVSAGKFKLEGAPWAPPTPEYLETLKARVDEVYGWFAKDVAIGRNDTPANVRKGYGEARVVPGAAALAANMADAIGTFEDAFARLSKRATKARRGTAASTLARKLDLDMSNETA